MKTYIDSQYIRKLFSGNPSIKGARDASNTPWRAATEIAGTFCGVSLSLIVLLLLGNNSVSSVITVLFLVFVGLLIVTFVCTVKWIQFRNKLIRLAFDSNSTFDYDAMTATFVKRENHGYDSTGDGFSYEFKANEKTYILSDAILLGDRQPTDEFNIVKIRFQYSNQTIATRIYAFNCSDFELKFENNQRQMDLFETKTVLGLIIIS